MSSAHRPTWDPAKGRADERHKSARVSAREMPSHTKLKFRQAQRAGSITEGRSDTVRRDLKRELEAAERENLNKKRKEGGLAPLADASSAAALDGQQDDVADERRNMIERLTQLDEDDQDVDESTDGRHEQDVSARDDARSLSDSSSDGTEDDEEDETAALLRELEKIKRERAEDKARQERERAELTEMSREEEIALGNPLLNLENALRRDSKSSDAEGSSAAARGGGGGGGGGGFGVKRRWDDDVIFKNQASGNDGSGSKAGFVNDLTRSEFHKRFMQRYVQ